MTETRGVPIRRMAPKSTDVLAAYVRRVDLFKGHAGAAFL
jgi:hypothetical protein